jgi:tetratricopeptide (TPR) repeat protein
MKRWRGTVLVVVSLVFVLTVAAGAGSVRINRVAPPATIIEGNVKTLYIEDFKGDPTDGMIKSNLGSLITAENRGEKERGGFWGLSKVNTLEKGPVTNPYTVVGDRAQAEVALGGEASMGPPQRAQHTEDRKRIVYQGDQKYEQVYTVYCSELRASMSMTMRANRTSDSVAVGSFSAQDTYKEGGCDERGYPQLSTDHDVAGKLAASTVQLLIDKFLPHYEEVKVKFRKDKAIKDANNAAEDGKYDKAMAMYNEAFKADEYNTAAIYNMGMLHELFGNYDQALKLYQTADGIAHDEDYTDAIERVNKRVEQVRKLQLMGMEITPHDFTKVAAIESRIKGDPGDREDIFASPDKKAAVVKKIPGGMKVEMVEEQGDWVKIKLGDGTEGWIKKNLVKTE